MGLAQLAVEIGNDREDMIGGEDAATQVGPAIDPSLPEIGIRKKALPPTDALQGRIAEIVRPLVAARLNVPKAGIEATDITAISRALATVEVPERSHGELLAAIFIEITAQAQRIDVPGEGVEDMMVQPGIDVNIGGVAGQRVGVIGPP